jgi:hypothetical protein
MRYNTVITEQFGNSLRLAYARLRSDLRSSAYVVLTRERAFGREDSHA